MLSSLPSYHLPPSPTSPYPPCHTLNPPLPSPPSPTPTPPPRPPSPTPILPIASFFGYTPLPSHLSPSPSPPPIIPPPPTLLIPTPLYLDTPTATILPIPPFSCFFLLNDPLYPPHFPPSPALPPLPPVPQDPHHFPQFTSSLPPSPPPPTYYPVTGSPPLITSHHNPPKILDTPIIHPFPIPLLCPSYPTWSFDPLASTTRWPANPASTGRWSMMSSRAATPPNSASAAFYQKDLALARPTISTPYRRRRMEDREGPTTEVAVMLYQRAANAFRNNATVMNDLDSACTPRQAGEAERRFTLGRALDSPKTLYATIWPKVLSS